MHPPFLNRLTLAALLLMTLASPALAEWRDFPYAKMAQMGLVLGKVDPQKIFTAAMIARPGEGFDALPADFRLQVKLGAKTIPVPILPDGRIELPIRQDWADADAQVQTNQPKGRVRLSMDLNSRTPPGTRLSYAQLTESVPVMERGIKEMAGVMSFLAPKVKQLTLRFAKGQSQTVTLTLPDGKRKLWKSNAEGHATIPWEPKWLQGAVLLSAPLQGIDQVLK